MPAKKDFLITHHEYMSAPPPGRVFIASIAIVDFARTRPVRFSPGNGGPDLELRIRRDTHAGCKTRIFHIPTELSSIITMLITAGRLNFYAGAVNLL